MSLWKWLRRWIGTRRERFGVEELARRLETPLETLRAIEPHYREFVLPKPRGGKRRIYAPDPALKQLQRRLLRRVLGRLRAHPAAMAYERQRSIVTHAARHQGQALVVQFDLKEFFPSTSARRVADYFLRLGWDRAATVLLLKLCTWHEGLPQGAPTSPRLSNLVNFGLDVRLEALARSLGAVYTRYADDLTFSFARDAQGGVVRRLFSGVRAIASDEGYRLHRRKKVRIRRRHSRQLVTGLVVNQQVNLPRATRRWLRAVEHRTETARRSLASRPNQPTLTPEQLAGWRSLATMIERQRSE